MGNLEILLCRGRGSTSKCKDRGTTNNGLNKGINSSRNRVDHLRCLRRSNRMEHQLSGSISRSSSHRSNPSAINSMPSSNLFPTSHNNIISSQSIRFLLMPPQCSPQLLPPMLLPEG